MHQYDHYTANPRPTVSITDEQIGPNNVSVTLKWVQKGVTFSSVRPPADLRLTENMSAQLTIPYNVQHNVSIAVCSQPPVKVAELYYGRQYSLIMHKIMV